MMNGSATILEDDSSRVLDKSAEPKKSVKSCLVSGVTGLFGGNSRSISWSEFVNSYLSLNLVERLEVSHDGWAKVILRSKQEENKSTKTSSSPEASSWLSLSALNNFRLPSMLSWEFDDISSVESSKISETESLDDDDDVRSSHRQNTTEPVIERDDVKILLQIGRPSYLER